MPCFVKTWLQKLGLPLFCELGSTFWVIFLWQPPRNHMYWWTCGAESFGSIPGNLSSTDFWVNILWFETWKLVDSPHRTCKLMWVSSGKRNSPQNKNQLDSDRWILIHPDQIDWVQRHSGGGGKTPTDATDWKENLDLIANLESYNII